MSAGQEQSVAVEVRLFATLRAGRFKSQVLDLPAGAIAGDVLARLGIAPDEVAILLVNGREGDASCPLGDGATLSLFPGVGGG